MKVFWRALLSALLLAMVVGIPAHAASPPDPQSVYERVANARNPYAAAQKLSPAEREALEVYLTPVTIAPIASEPEPMTALQVAAVSACKETGHVVGFYNVLGTLLWDWTLYAEVCYDGSRITFSYTRWRGNTYVPFWSWRTIDTHKVINTVINPDRLTAFGQAEFKFCAFADIGCVQYRYPWIELRFWANGSYSWRWGS